MRKIFFLSLLALTSSILILNMRPEATAQAKWDGGEDSEVITQADRERMAREGRLVYGSRI